MRITDLKTERTKDRARVAATVIWEDCNRPAGELYFETAEEFAEGLTCSPESFLSAAAIPAMHYGEKRVSIEAEVCPEFRAGLVTAMSYIQNWFLKDRGMPKLEVRTKKVFPAGQRPERSGFFFSGGVDSFATLRANRLNYPPEHPLYFRDGLTVFGLEMTSPEAFGHVLNAFSGAAGELGINLVPVYTNVYLPYREEDEGKRFSFWEYEFLGAALSSVAHAFSNRLSSVSISSTFSLTVPVPYGTHPLLDPYYGSTALRIRHEGFLHTRLDKVRLISDWDAALQNLRVCNQFKQYRDGALNCCNCEKCVRTMLELMALGVLEKTDAFPVKEISPKIIRDKVTIKGEYTNLSYKELIAPLANMGRQDLVRAIEAKMDEYRNRETNWRARLRMFDKRHLQGNFARMKKALVG